ncbi:MAG: polysaccharide deacetylase family protein [Gammaproteobacteria bacterium]|nr:polysaccharide deacetylase family protein [Gammaproteobacteria bacterium]
MLSRDAQQPQRLVLMYHGTRPGQTRPESEYSISSARFVEQLDLLRDLGWDTVRADELSNIPSDAPPSVAITFDDGYRDNYEGAFLPLVERNMRATWYLVSAKIGDSADWLTAAPTGERALMDMGQLKELASAGMELGAHTRTHADLLTLDKAQLEDEVAGCKRELEDLLGSEVASFAYPFGRFDAASVAACENAGYQSACTTRPGLYHQSESPLEVRRVTVFRDDTLGEFARKLVFSSNHTAWADMARYALARVKDRIRH